MVYVTSPLLASKNRQPIAFPDSKLRVKHVKTAHQLENGSNNGNHICQTCKNVVAEPVRVMMVS